MNNSLIGIKQRRIWGLSNIYIIFHHTRGPSLFTAYNSKWDIDQFCGTIIQYGKQKKETPTNVVKQLCEPILALAACEVQPSEVPAGNF